MSRPFTYLTQPYPFYYQGRKLWQLAGVIFGLAFFFNLVIQPFHTNYSELRWPFSYIALAHSVLPLALLLLLSALVRLNPRWTDGWTVGREIGLILLLLLLSGLANFLIRDFIYDNSQNWSAAYLYEELRNALLAGGLLATLIVSVNLNIQLLKNQELAAKLSPPLPNRMQHVSSATLTIETEVQSETFELAVAELCYAQADGNYVRLHLHSPAGSRQLLKRLSLKRLEELLLPFPQIIRTHRSYLLNLSYLSRVEGNAQGYHLTLSHCSERVPVSRNYLAQFNAAAAQAARDAQP